MEETAFVEEHHDDWYFNRLRLQAREFGDYEGGDGEGIPRKELFLARLY